MQRILHHTSVSETDDPQLAVNEQIAKIRSAKRLGLPQPLNQITLVLHGICHIKGIALCVVRPNNDVADALVKYVGTIGCAYDGATAASWSQVNPCEVSTEILQVVPSNCPGSVCGRKLGSALMC